MSLKLKKVLVLDGVDEECGRILQAAGIEVHTSCKLSEEDLIRELEKYDGLVIRSATKVTAKVLSTCNRLKVIGRAGTGVDNIDVTEATKKGILVMNTPGGNTLSAAEHTCALICALSRSIPEACASLKEGIWNRKFFMGNELFGKTLAIIGLGRIGREVAKRMKAFGMTTIGYDPLVTKETAQEWGIRYLPLDEIWPIADYITVHTPLIPQTRHLIGEKALGACKDTVKIVNVARGGIVDEGALLKALENKTCGGAALDVFQEEPPKDLTLVKHPKIICTPHLGANTYEAQKRVAVEIAQQLADMSEGRNIAGLINAPSLVKVGSDLARPWIQLASCLGSLAHTLIRSDTRNANMDLQLELFGKETQELKDLIGISLQMGLMKEITKNGTNLVNANVLAEEAGVKFNLVSYPDQQSPLSNSVSDALRVRIKSGASTHTIVGSSIGGKSSLFAVDDCVWPSGITLDRNMLFFRSSPSALPLVSIASSLQSSSLTSLLSSQAGTKAVWHVARTENSVKPLPTVPNAELLAQISF